MISESYPKAKKYTSYAPVVLGPTRLQQQQNNTVYPLTNDDNPRIVNDATKKGITTKEWHDRNNKIRAEFIKCPFHAGEHVVPRNPKDAERYIDCQIVGVARDYFDYGDDEWLEKGKPFILTFKVVDSTHERDKGSVHFATLDYFDKKVVNAC